MLFIEIILQKCSRTTGPPSPPFHILYEFPRGISFVTSVVLNAWLLCSILQPHMNWFNFKYHKCVHHFICYHLPIYVIRMREISLSTLNYTKSPHFDCL